MASKGWISLSRKIQDCFLWEDKPYSKGQAWIDLLLSANHESKKFMLGNEVILCERGDMITSIRKLSEKWGWSRNKVCSFLDLLENESMIVQKKDTKKTLVTIVNYDVYQDVDAEKRTQKGHEEDTQGTRKGHARDTQGTRSDTNNNDNNDNNEKQCNNVNNIKDNTICLEQKIAPDTNRENDNSEFQQESFIPTEVESYVIELPLNDKSMYQVKESDFNSWSELYPAVDIMQELRKMKGWCDANPKNRKTRTGIKRFIASWLAREQDRGRTHKNSSYTGNNQSYARNKQQQDLDTLQSTYQYFENGGM